MSLPVPTASLNRIKIVHSFDELLATPFRDGVNALCWQRSLAGNFQEVVESLVASGDTATLDDDRLRTLPLSDAGKAAVEILIEDRQLLQEAGLSPLLDCLKAYPRDEEPGPVVTHVYSFHADSAPVETDTYLCTYFGPASEGLLNEDSVRRVDIPETRAALLELYGGEDDEGFREYLNDHCYDLHYAALPGAQPYNFGFGNLWRIAVEYPDSPVPPCVHRAPDTLPGDPPRLLLIS